MEIKIKFEDKAFLKDLRTLERRLKAFDGGGGGGSGRDGPKTLYSQLGAIAQRNILDNFRQEGPGWRQLRPVTILDRERQGFPPEHPILVRRGNLAGLRGSIQYRAFSNRAEVGANKVYAAVMHYGAKAGSLWQGNYTVPATTVKSHKRRMRGGKTVTIKSHSRKAYTRKGQAPWGDIPPRPYMVLTDYFWIKAHAFIRRWLQLSKR